MAFKILFRADGNSKIGLGHLYRLFALVEMYKKHYEFSFLTRNDSTSDVFPKNYNLIKIPSTVPFSDESKWIRKNFSPENYIIIADGYQFDSNYQKKIKEFGYYLVYIDDFATEHMFADVVVNHSLAIRVTDFSAEPYTKFALGTDYAILRPFFLKTAKKKKTITELKNIFVCFGGSDFYDLTYKCVEGIIDIEKINEIHIVVGGANIHSNILKTKERYPHKLFIYRNLTEFQIVQIMEKCQLAIVPSSTISYEVFCVRMLVLGGFYVENQKNIYKGLKEQGIIYAAGDFSLLTEEDFKNKVLEILNSTNIEFEKIFKKQEMLFDGDSATRLISLLKQKL